jgi:hypothetical protein
MHPTPIVSLGAVPAHRAAEAAGTLSKAPAVQPALRKNVRRLVREIGFMPHAFSV